MWFLWLISEQVKIEEINYSEQQSKNVLINVHLSDQFRETVLLPMDVEHFNSVSQPFVLYFLKTISLVAYLIFNRIVFLRQCFSSTYITIPIFFGYIAGKDFFPIVWATS